MLRLNRGSRVHHGVEGVEVIEVNEVTGTIVCLSLEKVSFCPYACRTLTAISLIAFKVTKLVRSSPQLCRTIFSARTFTLVQMTGSTSRQI